jgi:hypothetical protein
MESGRSSSIPPRRDSDGRRPARGNRAKSATKRTRGMISPRGDPRSKGEGVPVRKGPPRGELNSRRETLRKECSAIALGLRARRLGLALESARGGDPRTEIGRLEGRMAGIRGSHEPPVRPNAAPPGRGWDWRRECLQATRGRIVGGPHVQPPPSDRRLIPPSRDAAPRGLGRRTS